MKLSKRDFLKIAGLGIVGVGVKPVANAIAQGEGVVKAQPYDHSPEALVGKRWGMVVNTRACPEGCTDCINACNSAHNIPDIGTAKEEIKWIWKDGFENGFPSQLHEYVGESIKHSPVVLLCNHCDNPPCVRVCPTKATFKRADGIVMMDMHRCIGCRFCMAACPYGSRSFNWRDPKPFIKKQNPDFPTRTKGVVEKCNFCAERLAKGLRPACVEACKHGALIFGDVADESSPIRSALSRVFTIRRKPELGTRPQIYYIV